MIQSLNPAKVVRYRHSLRSVYVGLIALLATTFQAQVTYTFTNAGATGRFGPTQLQLNTAYGSTNLNGLVTTTAGIQTWTVPAGVTSIKIEAYGAQGGSSPFNAGGLGAYMSGNFTVTPGQVLKILVGQAGINSTNSIYAAGGGGGSYVSTISNTPMIVAGGGSGSGGPVAGLGATTGSVGNPGMSCSSAGTTGFGGGSAQFCGSGAGGAGGFYGDGSSTGSYGAQFGYGFVNGGNGGNSMSGGMHGGFGGGAGTHQNNTGGGAGGGYTGGGASNHGGNWAGGGGSSYNAGTSQSNSAAVNSGNGKVIISTLAGVTIITSSPISCYGQFSGALTASMTGGTPPFTYSWAPMGLTTQSISGLAAGSYTAYITDGTAFTYSTSISLTEPPLLQNFVVSQSSITCNGGSNGSVGLSVFGGTGPYSYTWLPTGGSANVATVGSSRVDLQACKLEYSIVSPK